MDIKDFISGTYRDGYQYKYFLPEQINHPWVWMDETINFLLETASLRLGKLNSARISRRSSTTGTFGSRTWRASRSRTINSKLSTPSSTATAG